MNHSLGLEVVANDVHLVVRIPNSDSQLRIVMSIDEATGFMAALQEAIKVAKTPIE